MMSCTRKITLGRILAAAVLLAWPLPCFPQELMGRVVDENNQTVAGAKVVIK